MTTYDCIHCDLTDIREQAAEYGRILLYNGKNAKICICPECWNKLDKFQQTVIRMLEAIAFNK